MKFVYCIFCILISSGFCVDCCLVVPCYLSKFEFPEMPQLLNVASSHFVFDNCSEHLWLEIPECSSLRASRCNLTSSFSGLYASINATLRVRAYDGKQDSPWSHSRPFQALFQSLLGPPNVTLSARRNEGWLEVRIRDPFDRSHLSPDLKFRLYYKKEDSDWMVYNDISSFVLIDTFEEGFKYCVKAHYLWRGKLRPNSIPSTPKCAMILESESARSIRIMWVTGLMVCVTLAFVLFGIYMGPKFYDKLKQALRPPLQLPEHLHEFLSGEEQFVQFPASSSSSSEDEPFDKVSLVTIDKEVVLEEPSSTHGHTRS
ncbi:interferon gamma receptor 2 [Conger conger]|uniref:interferon gamma receptor 2 n=1 Tax=Conger conger TaxID=82655 RepID=UPI002A5A136B|nr:interferon gamma receptor 2 [Conger conger]XP_061089392.1 interferon gamma receptor 2 [Conger conger]